MFRKKPTIKSLSSLRSSDRRKIADQIISDFNIELPKHDSQEVDQNDQDANSLTLGDIRNSLLPEGSQSARFTTTAGPNLSQVSGTVYVGAHPGHEQRILWIKFEERLFPTVYTLWRHPRLVPLLHTPAPVLQKLQGGADLMTPGLARGPPFPSGATLNSIVAIASLDRPSVPRVVGICEIDVSSLQQVQGAKGHAVRGYHWDGDEIWGWSQSGKSGSDAPKEIEGWDLSDSLKNLPDRLEGLSVTGHDLEAEETRTVLENEDRKVAVKTTDNKYVDGVDAMLDQEAHVNEAELTVKEIDDIFLQAFCYGVYHYKKSHQEHPTHGLDFPLTQSFVISHLVLPFLPIWTPSQANSLQMKRTSWKSVKKFVKALDKRLLLKSKDRDGGETVILDIDFAERAFKNFVPYTLPKKDAGTNSEGGERGKINPSVNDESVGQQLSVLQLLRPKEQLSPIFEASNANLKSLYLATEVRSILTSYIDSEDLTSAANKRLVNLNPFLTNTLYDGKSSLDHEIRSKGSVPRDAMAERVLERCSPFFAILRNEDTRETAKAKAGQLPKVQITYETRSGNKTVTKISGLEAFYVNPQILADELQKACASSTSVSQLVGSSPKHPVMEVVVQGPHKNLVLNALEKRGVKPTWVEHVNKVKGGKTGNKR